MTKTEMLLAQLDKIAYNKTQEELESLAANGLLNVWTNGNYLQIPQVQYERCRRLITECHMLMDGPTEFEVIDVSYAIQIKTWTKNEVINTGFMFEIWPDGKVVLVAYPGAYPLVDPPKPSPVYTAEAVQAVLGDSWKDEDDEGYFRQHLDDLGGMIIVNSKGFVRVYVDTIDWQTILQTRKGLAELEDACRKLADHGYKIEGWES